MESFRDSKKRTPLTLKEKQAVLKQRREKLLRKERNLILRKEELTMQIKELSKQRNKLKEEEKELRKQEELEKEKKQENPMQMLDHKEIESSTAVIGSASPVPLFWYRKLKPAEVKFSKRLRRHKMDYRSMVTYGFPMEKEMSEGVITIFEYPRKRRYPRIYKVYGVNLRYCDHCYDCYPITESGGYAVNETCVHHWGKLGPKSEYTCCGGRRGSKGCRTNRVHVWKGIIEGDNGPYYDFYRTTPRPLKSIYETAVYALDCEMCYTLRGIEVTKVTVIGYDGKMVLDTFVRPTSEIVDYCTHFSGVTADDLCEERNENLKTLAEVQQVILQLIDADTILIGHGLENDLRALRIAHKTVVDTAFEFPHPLGFPYRHSLRNLAKKYLNRDIQCGNEGHDSLEDARASLDLVKWKLRNKMGPKEPWDWI